MGKYPIGREFYPFALFRPPLCLIGVARLCNVFLRPPRSFFRGAGAVVTRETFPGQGGAALDAFLVRPEGARGRLPCLVFYHGGGFALEASWQHYAMARELARRVGCAVLMPRYRLAPKFPFPTPAEDAFEALRQVLAQAGAWGIDPARIGLGGDSAGGCLAAAVALMARDRLGMVPRCQLLLYPVLDRRMETRSHREYTDTPMWNSVLSRRMWRAYLPEGAGPVEYASPAEAGNLSNLPPTYIEVAQFDCLRDEGLAYGQALQAAGIPVELREIQGGIHGFDIAARAPSTRDAMAARARFLGEWLGK